MHSKDTSVILIPKHLSPPPFEYANAKEEGLITCSDVMRIG